MARFIYSKKKQMRFDYLIIGGGVAGTTAAETIRGIDATSTIAIISDEPHRLYSRVLLPHYTKDKVAESQTFLREAANYDARQITLLVSCRVEALQDSKTVVTDRYGSIEFGKLLIATGGRPRIWDCENGMPGIYRFQTLEDAIRLKIDLPHAKHFLIVGGGFIGLELASIAVHYKIRATIIVANEWYWWHSLVKEEATVVHAVLKNAGVDIVLQDDVREIEGDSHMTGVVLDSGARIACDMIGLGIGLTPNIEFAEGKVETSNRGIMTDEFLRSSVPHIFAAGDVADFMDPILNIRHQQGNWANAVHHGRVAGANMAGKETRLGQVASYATNAFPGLQIAFVGDGRDQGMNKNICRYDVEKNSYGRLITRDNRVVGGVFINRPQDVAATMKLIESKKEIPVSQDLSQIDFDLKTLL